MKNKSNSKEKSFFLQVSSPRFGTKIRPYTTFLMKASFLFYIVFVFPLKSWKRPRFDNQEEEFPSSGISISSQLPPGQPKTRSLPEFYWSPSLKITLFLESPTSVLFQQIKQKLRQLDQMVFQLDQPQDFQVYGFTWISCRVTNYWRTKSSILSITLN